MTIHLTAGQALRLSYLIEVGKENIVLNDVKEVGDNVLQQIEIYIKSLEDIK